MSWLGPLAAFGSSLTWAFAATRYAKVAPSVRPARINLVRAMVASGIYGAGMLLGAGDHPFAGITPGRLSWLVFSILCSYAVADSLFLVAARRLGIATGLSLATIYPLWAALYGSIFRGEPLGPARLFGMLLCIGGVVMLVRQSRPPTGDADDAHHPGINLGGIAIALLTSVMWAGNSVALKAGAAGVPLATANAIRFTVGIVILLPQAFWRPIDPAEPSLRQLLSQLWPAIVCDAGLGGIFYVYGISHTDLAVGATLSSLAPLISVPIALAMGTESWNVFRFVAVTVTVTGMAILMVG